jgi:hypothetical protein
MKYADNAWLFFAVSIPLTLFTIMVWYSWANHMLLYQALVVQQKKSREKMKGRLKDFTIFKKAVDLPR